MARIAAVLELQPTDRRISQDAGNNPRRDASPNDDGLMEQILEDLNTTPPEEVLQRIASSPDIRRDKVLTIRRQIVQGTYCVEDRLNRTTDRIMEDISAAVTT